MATPQRKLFAAKSIVAPWLRNLTTGEATAKGAENLGREARCMEDCVCWKVALESLAFRTT